MNQEQNVNTDAPVQKTGMSLRQKTTLIFSVLLIIGLVAFVVQNYNYVKIEFFMWEFRVRIIYLMVFSAVIGMFTVYAFQKYLKAKRKK